MWALFENLKLRRQLFSVLGGNTAFRGVHLNGLAVSLFVNAFSRNNLNSELKMRQAGMKNTAWKNDDKSVSELD